MDLETVQTATTAKLPILKQGEYDMWRLRIEQYFQVQDYALWDVIENGNSFKPVAQTTTNADGTSTSLIAGPTTTEEKVQKKNDEKARSMLLMELPNEHLMTFNQYKDAKTLFAAIQTRFSGNDATKKTQKTLLKQMNRPDLDTISFNDLCNNFKIVEQEVKGTASSSSSLSSHNMAFVSSPSSTNEVNTAYGVSTANTQVSPASTQVSTGGTQVSTANLSDDTVYAFLASQPNGSQLVYEDLEQIHEDDIEEMDLKWQLALLSMRTRRSFQKTGRKITINGSDTVGYDKSKVECFNYHKMGYFTRECRGPRNQDSRNRNQDSSRRTVNVEETSSKAMVAIDGAGFDWGYMADEEVPTNMALIAFSDSDVHNDKICSKTCLKIFETLKTQLDDLRIEFNKSEFNLATYKKGLTSVEEQLVFYKKNEVFIFCEQLLVLKRDISYKDSEISMLKSELEKLNQEKESNQLKIEKFDNASKSLEKLIGSQIPDKSRKSVGFPKFEGYGPKSSKSVSEYISNEVRESSDAPLVEELVSDDKLEKKIVFPIVAKMEFVRPKQQEKLVRKPVKYAEMYRSQSPRKNQINRNNQKSQYLGSDFVMYNKACFVCGGFDHVQIDCNYHQRERVVFGNNYTRVNYNYSAKKTHPSAHRNMVPRAVLMKTGLRSLNTARSINTAHPKTTVYSARPMPKAVNTVRPNSAVVNAIRANQNRVLIVKPHNKTPYELFRGRTPVLSFMRQFGCHVTILTTLDYLGKFDGKSDEGFFVGYSLNSKAFRVYNIRTRKVEENLHIRFLEDKPIIAGDGPKWLFDIDVLTKSMNYVPVVAGTNSNDLVDNATATHADFFGDETKVDMSNITITYPVPSTPNTRIHKDHSPDHVIGDVQSGVLTRRMTKTVNEQGFISVVYEGKSHEDLHTYRSYAIRASTVQVTTGLDLGGFTTWLVTQGYTQEEGIDYDKVFAPVARIEAIRLFLAYASFKDFVVYQMDVKSAFLYGKIEEEVYVCQPPRFEMQSSLTEFISQDKYVDEILKKFGFSTVKTASTPMETSKPLLKDAEAEDVDVHLYRSMIGSLMYLTSSRPDIMFVVCACARFQVTPKVSHLHAVKRIFRYLKGQPKLGLWYPKDSPFDLEAYTDSDYAGASLDRKSTTGGCQFLGSRLISWQCKKQTIVANSTTEAEYVAAASCCGQVLWIQNQMLDYGYNFMNTKIFIDNESTICIVKNPVFHSKTKHIEIRHHFIRDSNKKKLIQMIKIHTDQNVTDLLTKAFDVGRFQYLIATAANDEIQVSVVGLTFYYVLTVNPIIYTSCIKQFSANAKAKTVNGEVQIQALEDGKKVIVTDTGVRRALQVNYAEGTECLPNATIFAEMKRMGAKTTAWNEFSSTMSSAIILFMDKQVEGMTKHKKIYVTPSHTKKVFANMKREGKCFSERPQKKQPRRKQRNDTEVPQPNGSTKPITDEATNKEHVPIHSNNPLLNGLGAQKNASKQGRKIDDLDGDVKVTLVDEAQERNDDNLMFDTGVFYEQEVEVEKVVSTAEVTTVSTTTTTINELTLAQTLIEIKAAKPKVVTTAAATPTTVVTRPKARRVVVQEPSEFTTTTSQPSQLP
ncbi:putative ribonuclease H-like domain-containing protein [Tanacetum coccineum]